MALLVSLKVTRRKLADLPAKIRGPRSVKVGFIAGETDSDIINRAVWNEFGTRGGGWGGPIPERPFMRNAARKMKDNYGSDLAKAAKGLVEGRTKLAKVLSKIGIKAAGDIQKEITALRSPPNADITIERKGSSNPLIDTGEMRQAVTHKLGKD